MKTFVLLLLGVQVLFGSYSTDLDILKKAVRDALQDFPALHDEERVYLIEEARTEGDFLVRNGLTEKLKEQDIEVLYSPFDGVELRYKINELKVIYKNRFRKWFFGKSYVERLARAEFNILLLKDHTVQQSLSLSGSYSDVVPESEIPLLKSGQFTQEEVMSESGSIIEPLLVVGIVGVLIFLFYAPGN